jgi:precorrin-6A/cobalt-precorrin-6A reductase
MIWLIGGTRESVALAQLLTEARLAWIVTVVTPQAKRLYQHLPGPVHAGALTSSLLPTFLQEHQIRLILDASHPFALQISRLALQAGLPYLRFERSSPALYPEVQCFSGLDQLLRSAAMANQRLLLTLGVQSLPHFKPWLSQSEIWARLLPDSLSKAITAGFSPERLILARPPFSLEEELDLWSQLQIEAVITKDSGYSGGLEIKQQAARLLGVQLMVISRPPLTYPQMTTDLQVALHWCQQMLGELSSLQDRLQIGD